jgi:hypothetical protein
MPFKSRQQAKFLFAKKPEIAREFASKTPSIKALPARKHQINSLKRNAK